MIHTNRTVTVGNQESIIDSPIILYRGDREVEVEFTLNGNKFTFTNGGNVIKSTNAVYGQLVINTPSGENMFSEITGCHEGKVVFVITKEMIDELIEVGFYSFQIRLFDESQVSRVTIPPVHQGVDIREPIAAEDETNVVDIGLVDYAIVVKDNYEDLSTFLPSGDYNKTDWESRDLISAAKLNKIEDAIFTINDTVESTDLALFNRLDSVNQTLTNNLNTVNTNLSNEINNVNRTLTNELNQLEIDMNTADATLQSEHEVLENKIDDNYSTLSNKIDNRYNTLNSAKVDTTTFNSKIWSMANMGQDVKTAMTGGSVAVVGDNAVLTQNIADQQVTNPKIKDNSITRAKLTPTFNYVRNLNAEDNLDTITDSGVYICIGKPLGSPSAFATYSYYLEVQNMATFTLQIATLYNHPGTRYGRVIRGNGDIYDWEPMLTLEPLAVKTGHIDDNAIIAQKLHAEYNYGGILDNTHDLNTIKRTGVYLCIGVPANGPAEFRNSSYFLTVEFYRTWVVQTAWKFEMPHVKFTRKIDNAGTVYDWQPANSLNMGELPANTNLDTFLTHGQYMSSGDQLNGPDALAGKAIMLDVYAYASNFRWIRQECSEYAKPNCRYVRFIDKQGTVPATAWESYKTFELQYNSDHTVDGGDLNDVLEVGNYVFINNPANNPLSTTSGLMTIEKFNKNWFKQTVVETGSTDEMWVRIIQRTGTGTMYYRAWAKYNSVEGSNVVSATDLNDVVQAGSYIYANDPANNPLSSISGALEVDAYNKRWIIQRVMHLKEQRQIYMRIIDTNASSYYVSEWQCIVPPEGLSKLEGKVIVNFGDSIFGNTRNNTSVSAQIAQATGATVHNCGFGGCRMSKHTGYWDAFSMYNLVDAIISRDFSAQELGANASDSTCPSYFKETVELLKSIDFNTVDYVTIAYGTNDYTAGKRLDVGKGDKNIDAYAGALRYSIEQLLTNFPHIKLLICTPIWRWWEAEGGITSDERTYNAEQDTLIDFKNKVIEVCEEYHVPYLNGYDNVGINEFTKRYYFTSPDGTHPNANGNKRYAQTIVGRLEQM